MVSICCRSAFASETFPAASCSFIRTRSISSCATTASLSSSLGERLSCPATSTKSSWGSRSQGNGSVCTARSSSLRNGLNLDLLKPLPSDKKELIPCSPFNSRCIHPFAATPKTNDTNSNSGGDAICDMIQPLCSVASTVAKSRVRVEAVWTPILQPFKDTGVDRRALGTQELPEVQAPQSTCRTAH
jgi:hypothetical protein